MRILFTCMTAACALATAAPAAAQYGNVNSNSSAQFNTRLTQIESRIQSGISAGTIDRREAFRLRTDVRNVRRLYYSYARNGLSQNERADLQTRIRNLRQEMRIADGGRFENRAYAGQRYDRNGRLDNNGMFDRNGNRIDVGVYGQGGLYGQGGVYGQGGPYEPVNCVDRGGIGGIIDDLFGDDYDCDNNGFRVGQRVTGNLGSVPSNYGYRYRDGNGVYYRSDGRNIYQIDARTQTVLRVYDIDR